jgi:hypothetical protein
LSRGHADAPKPAGGLGDAVRWWELARIPYNLALGALALGIVVRTWPHFAPAVGWRSVPPLAVLALLANLCYCAAYVLERVAQLSGLREAWTGRRWIAWLAGTALALFVEGYWILDEIYPAVPFRG